MEILRQDVQRLVGSNVSVFKYLRLIFSYRLMPVILLRLSQWLRGKKIPFVSDLLSMINFILFGLEAAKQCQIGPGLIIPHSQGVILGADKIGINATIFSCVTLGAKNLGVPFRKSERPVIGNNVTIGSGAKILGGVVIGDNSIIGANAVVTVDVPTNSLAVGVPAVIKIKEKLV